MTPIGINWLTARLFLHICIFILHKYLFNICIYAVIKYSIFINRKVIKVGYSKIFELALSPGIGATNLIRRFHIIAKGYPMNG